MNSRVLFALLCAYFLLLIALSTRFSGADAGSNTAILRDRLSSVQFRNIGTVRSDDVFVWGLIPCGYLEDDDSFRVDNACPYRYQLDPDGVCVRASVSPGTVLEDGYEIAYETVPSLDESGAVACADACCELAGCVAWQLSVPATATPNCAAGKPCCTLVGRRRKVLPATHASQPSWTGTANNTIFTAPPLGIRSAVPIGGVAAGNFELRADGSLATWTVMNASPAGAGKLHMAEALLAVHVTDATGRATTKALQTHPAEETGVVGVDGLTYSGSFPVARLVVADDDLPVDVSVFAYSPYRNGDLNFSITPAAAFTALVRNPTNAPMHVSFMLTLPPFGWSDSARTRPNAVPEATAATPSACAALCGSKAPDACSAWYRSAVGECFLYNASVAVPLAFPSSSGTSSGLRASWELGDRAVSYVSDSPGVVGGPQEGSVTLMGVASERASVSRGTAHSLRDLFSHFARTGNVDVGEVRGPNSLAAQGAVSLSATVGPGETLPLSVVLGWYFPNLDIMGEIMGNQYANLFSSSADVASRIADEGELSAMVGDALAFHAPFFNSTMPAWLSDSLVNSASHIRTAMYLRNGWWRQWEAPDCPDVDSVHNDYQRHLPYVLAFPWTEQHKLRFWAKYQQSDGMIQEYFDPTYISPFDTPGGRVMGDVTSVWVIEFLELYRTTGDRAFFNELLPNARRAIQWLLATAAAGDGIPANITCTYDLLLLELRGRATYNAHLHVTAMLACEEIATTAGDAYLAYQCARSRDHARAAIDEHLWVDLPDGRGHYRVHDSSPNVMADSLYGAIVAQFLGLGWTVTDTSKLSKQLNAELANNWTPYGLRVLGGPNLTMEVTVWKREVEAIWMGGSMDWAAAALYLGRDPAESLHVAEISVENYRSHLRDFWNIAGLTEATQGGPYVTSHYGYYMVEWFIPFALSGQVANVPKSQLSFHPKVPAPYRLPVLLPNVLGTLDASVDSSTGHVTYSICLTLGGISFDDLRVGASRYPGTAELRSGACVAWS